MTSFPFSLINFISSSEDLLSKLLIIKLLLLKCKSFKLLLYVDLVDKNGKLFTLIFNSLLISIISFKFFTLNVLFLTETVSLMKLSLSTLTGLTIFLISCNNLDD